MAVRLEEGVYHPPKYRTRQEQEKLYRVLGEMRYKAEEETIRTKIEREAAERIVMQLRDLRKAS